MDRLDFHLMTPIVIHPPLILISLCLNKLIPVSSGIRIIDSDATVHCPASTEYNHFRINTHHEIHEFKCRPFSEFNLDNLVG